MEEKRLAEQAVKGNQEAFCELYDLYKDRLFRYAFYRLGDAASAEDAVSDSVLDAWKSIGALRNPRAFSPWIFRILNVKCSKQLQRMISEKENLARYYRERNQTLPDSSLALELTEALGILAEDEREIVLLSVVAGLKSREIASVFECSSGTVRSKLSRSLLKMRKYLEMQS